MTAARAQSLACEAALLDDDKESAALLRQELDTLMKPDTAMCMLLLGYVWVAPEDALRRCQQHSWFGQSERALLPHKVEEIRDAVVLFCSGAEKMMAYAAMTTLLGRSSVQYYLRLGVQRQLLALASPHEFLGRQDWESMWVNDLFYKEQVNVFLAARLWKACPVYFWEILQEHTNLAGILLPIGHWVLSAKSPPENLSLLIAISQAQCRQRRGTFSEMEVPAMRNTLEILAVHAPQELERLLPSVMATIGKGHGDDDFALVACALVLIVRLSLDQEELVRLLIPRLRKRREIATSRRWARRIQKQIRQYMPLEEQAGELSSLLRALALERRIDIVLTGSKADNWTDAQVCRAWRWLERSEPIIASVAQGNWREYLYNRKALLESERKLPAALRTRRILLPASEAE